MMPGKLLKQLNLNLKVSDNKSLEGQVMNGNVPDTYSLFKSAIINAAGFRLTAPSRVRND